VATEVRDTGSQYEITVDGVHAGLMAYLLREGHVVITHTETDPAFEGRRMGSTLVAQALDDLRRRELLVVPLCPFVKGWIARHPDYADLVAT
jgi:predicted GNAT family acetyltransferase